MKLSSSVIGRVRGRPYYAFLYAKNVLKGRLPEYLVLFFKDDPQSAYLYAVHVVRGKLPDPVHNALLLYSMEKKDMGGFVVKYLDFLEGK